jgi:hypothetical protein
MNLYGNRYAMTRNRPIFFILCFTIALIIFSGSLLSQNKQFRQSNRKLILQNDSLKSVVIELSRKKDSSTSQPNQPAR